MASRIKEHGLNEDELAKALELATPALAGLKGRLHGEAALPHLTIPAERKDLAGCVRLAEHLLKDSRDIVVYGVGGSSLGAQALAQLACYRLPGPRLVDNRPQIHFFENLDAFTLEHALSRFNLPTTRFLVISKSGGGSTLETLVQLVTTIAALKADGHGSELARYFAIIAGPGDNPMRRIARDIGCPIIDHHPGIGGRFAVLTNVGLVPALCLGLDPLSIRSGAREVADALAGAATPEHFPPALGAAISVGLAARRRISTTVMMPYSDRLELFAMWYRQLWAESLGKGGKGTTPVRALGPVDQHSQLQLYLDGPRDKLFTLIMTDCAGQGLPIEADPALAPDLAFLRGRYVGDVVDAHQRATAETLIANGRPTRIFRIDQPNERVLGALFMHFMLETILAARMLKVDPFDQPAVEQGKVLARKYLVGDEG